MVQCLILVELKRILCNKCFNKLQKLGKLKSAGQVMGFIILLFIIVSYDIGLSM